MSDTQGSDDAAGVLKPFEGAPAEPLPPIEPSRVVPEDRAPEVPDVITPDDVVNAPGAPPVEGDVPDITPAEPDIEDIWAAVESEEYIADEPAAPAPDPEPEAPSAATSADDIAEVADDIAEDEPAAAAAEDDRDENEAELDAEVSDDEGHDDDEPAAEIDDGADDDVTPVGEDREAVTAPAGDDNVDEVPAAPEATDDVRLEEDPALAPAGHDAASGPDTVTLPRTAFLIGLGAVGVVLLVLLGLWQTADGGDGSTVLAGEPDPTEETTPDADTDSPDDADSIAPAPGVDPADLAAAEELSANLQSEIDGLAAQVDALEGELAEVPPPALPGDALHRIPVASGSKFVSATDVSVAVVSPFGGYANINPATDSVTAAGVVSGGATRVIRTGTSVWVTNYSENKVIRIDPQANSVSLVYDFVGPDGLAKFGDSLLVASFDGQFLAQLHPGTGVTQWEIPLGGKPTDVLVTPEDGVWVALFDTGELVRIDPRTQEVIDRVLVGAGPVGLTTSPEGIWVANHNEGTVALVDPDSASVSMTIEVGDGPTELISHGNSLWVTVTDAGDLVEIDAPTGEIIGRTSLGGPGIGGGPVGIDIGAGSLWVAMDGEDSVVRIALPE